MINKQVVLALGLMFSVNTLAWAYSAPIESRDDNDYAYGEWAPANNDAYSASAENSAGYGNDYVADDLSTQQTVYGQDTEQPGFLQRMQQMDQEIRDLRGQLEMQSHAIKQLQDSQRQQYQDLDQRLSQLSQGGTVAAATPQTGKATPANNNAAKTTAAAATDNPAPTGNVVKEQEAYQNAYEFIRNKQYSRAIPALQDYLTQYPKGQFSVNAHYWLGELSLLTGDSNMASTEFSHVVDDYPTSSKVPDAMLKLGFIYADEGNYQKSKQQLTKVTEKFPGSPTARLAEQRLQQLAEQGH